MSCSSEHCICIVLPGYFQDDRAMKADTRQLLQQPSPVDLSVAWWQMIVTLSMVVARVHHPKMTGKLLYHRGQIARKIGVSRVETDTDVGRFKRSEYPE